MAVDTRYGRDMAATDVLDPSHIVTGARLVAEAAYRRLTTRRGLVLDAPDYGLDVKTILQARIGRGWLDSLRARIATELRKDERVRSLSVSCKQVGDDREPRIEALIVGTCGAGPFRLVVSISTVTSDLLGIEA